MCVKLDFKKKSFTGQSYRERHHALIKGVLVYLRFELKEDKETGPKTNRSKAKKKKSK